MNMKQFAVTFLASLLGTIVGICIMYFSYRTYMEHKATNAALQLKRAVEIERGVRELNTCKEHGLGSDTISAETSRANLRLDITIYEDGCIDFGGRYITNLDDARDGVEKLVYSAKTRHLMPSAHIRSIRSGRGTGIGSEVFTVEKFLNEHGILSKNISRSSMGDGAAAQAMLKRKKFDRKYGNVLPVEVLVEVGVDGFCRIEGMQWAIENGEFDDFIGQMKSLNEDVVRSSSLLIVNVLAENEASKTHIDAVVNACVSVGVRRDDCNVKYYSASSDTNKPLPKLRKRAAGSPSTSGPPVLKMPEITRVHPSQEKGSE